MACNTINFKGDKLVVQWIYSGGTLNCEADYLTLALNPSTDRVDAAAGDDDFQDMGGNPHGQRNTHGNSDNTAEGQQECDTGIPRAAGKINVTGIMVKIG